jgi:hypothetical protein
LSTKEGTRNGALRQLRGAEMLNIRISFTVNLKKFGATLLAGVVFFAHFVTPAYALPVTMPVIVPVSVSIKETPVTVSLAHLTVTTTKTEAKTVLNSSDVKFFDAQALAFLTTYSQGWDLNEWKCLNNIWDSESHFNPKAKNLSSGAYGIAQFLPSTWRNYKVSETPSAQLQIKYGLRYIMKRYGRKNDPAGACNAWNFHQKNGWY